jgi:hypothetical protein
MGDNFQPGAFIWVIAATTREVTPIRKKFEKVLLVAASGA